MVVSSGTRGSAPIEGNKDREIHPQMSASGANPVQKENCSERSDQFPDTSAFGRFAYIPNTAVPLIGYGEPGRYWPLTDGNLPSCALTEREVS